MQNQSVNQYPMTVFDVADYFLKLVPSEYDDVMTHLKLQKLVYYAQGFYYALNNEPLYKEKIYRWEHGPVVKELWDKYSDKGKNPIEPPDIFIINKYPKDVQKLLNNIWDTYGQYSAWGLRNLTHTEPPWLNTSPNEEITLSSLKLYFITRINGKTKRN